MDIAFFTRLFYPHIGGVEKHVFEVAKRLAERGHTVKIFAESASMSNIDRNWHSETESATLAGKNTKIQVHFIKSRGNSRTKKFHLWLSLWKARHLFSDTDVVHCHDVFFWYFPFRFLYPRKKVFTTFHGYEMKYPPDKKSVLIRKLSEKLSYGNICVGDYIRKWYKTIPSIVLYGGIDEKMYKKTKNAKKDKKVPKILLFGRLERDNGAAVYLEGLKDLKRRKIPYELSICGKGSYAHELGHLGTFLTPIWDPVEYIKRADLILSSSYLSMLEALASGKMVISVSTNPLKDDYLRLSPFNKWIQIVNTYGQLSKIIAQWSTSEPIESKKIRKSQEWALSQTWDKVTDEYIKLWNSSS